MSTDVIIYVLIVGEITIDRVVIVVAGCLTRTFARVICLMCVLFLSSRRRHTRFDCDWSSDVCSSDLVQRRGGASRTRRLPTRCFPTSTSIWNSAPTGRDRGTQSSPARLAPVGSSPAVPTSVPRRSVTRARAAGASRPITATRTRLLRPSGCWYSAVGVASMTIGGTAPRGRGRPTSGRLPSQATKLRRPLNAGQSPRRRAAALPRGGPPLGFPPAEPAPLLFSLEEPA